MSRIGVKDGDTMHGFYKTLPPEPSSEERNNNASSSTSHPRTGQHSPQLDEDDFFDEISRWFVPAIGGILGSWLLLNCILPIFSGVAWLYLITAPYPMTFSTHLSMFFITSVFVGFLIMNRAWPLSSSPQSLHFSRKAAIPIVESNDNSINLFSNLHWIEWRSSEKKKSR